MNKYALLHYVNSNNVGDEIQSIAARRFLPTVDYYIDRDRLAEWHNDNRDESVKLIANGWYMHEPYGWPITDKTLDPLLLSIHINRSDNNVVRKFASKSSRDFMNSHGPVGARDHTTRKFFNKVGINSYFSACITLTLQRDTKINRQDYILAVSVSDETYSYIKRSTKRRVIRLNPYADRGIDNIEKTKIAEHILFLYQSAYCVVTTKIHAMLPSLALETPVMFVDENEEFDPSRFDGLVELVNSTSRDDLVSGKYSYDFDNPPDNPDQYSKYREELIGKCEGFTGHNNEKSFARLINVSDINQSLITSKIPVTDDELSASQIISYIKPPTFSIVMPAYNIGSYIVEAVTSIKNQGFTDYECIIVDDGSTDRGLDAIEEIIKDDKRFKILTQKNGGLSNARNNGYKLTKGEYVLFLDGDDVFSTRLLELIHEKIVDTHAELIVFNHSVLDTKTGHVGGSVHYLSSLAKKKSVTPRQISRYIFNIFGNQVWTKAFKRELIEKNDLSFNEELKRAEDIPYTYPAILYASKIAVIDEPLVAYRVNRGDSNSDKLTAHYKDIFSALSALYAVVNKQSDAEKYKGSFNKLFIENVYYNLRSLVGSERFKDEFLQAQKYTEKFNITTKDDSLIEIYDILKGKDYIEMLTYMVTREGKELADKQTTIYHLEDHILQLQKSLSEKEDKIHNLERVYSELIRKYDRMLNIPRKLKHGAKRIAGGGKTT